MHNNKILKIVTLAIILIIVNGLLLLIIDNYSVARVINQIFLNLGIITFLGSPFIEDNTKENEYLNYYKIPVFKYYFVITTILSIILFILNFQNLLITIVPQLLVTGICIVVFFTLKMADNNTINSDNAIKDKRVAIKDFENKLKIIMSKTSNNEIYKKVEKAYDNARSLKININGDPSEIDSEILNEISLLENCVSTGNNDEIDKIVNEINTNFVKRNNL